MTLNGVMALILRYFTEFGSFRAHCVKVVEGVVKKFTFAISSPDEFVFLLPPSLLEGRSCIRSMPDLSVCQYESSESYRRIFVTFGE